MDQGRAAVNGSFQNIDEIIRRANPVQFAQEQAINDIVELIEDFTANKSGGDGNTLEAILGTNIAAKLPAGAVSQITNAIFLEVERRDRTGFAEFGSEQWERVKKDAKDERERLDKIADLAGDANDAAERREAEAARQQRAEAWANSDHTYAGQKMSASEWLRMIQWFKQPENRAAWEDAMMAQTGQSREKVRATGDKIAELDELIAKEARGEVLTPEQQARKAVLGNDRNVQEGIELRTAMADPKLAKSAEMNIENGVDAVEARGDAFAVADKALLAQPNANPSLQNESADALAGARTIDTFAGTSVARELDEVAPQGERLNATFARAATGELPATQTAPQVAVATVRPTANFDANAGMI